MKRNGSTIEETKEMVVDSLNLVGSLISSKLPTQIAAIIGGTLKMIYAGGGITLIVEQIKKLKNRVFETYEVARHNKRITRLLMERISVANAFLTPLREENRADPIPYYENMQRLVKT